MVLVLVFCKICTLFPQQLHDFAFAKIAQGYQIFHILNTSVVFCCTHTHTYMPSYSTQTHMILYLIVVLICISLMISNVEHLSLYLLVICISPFQKCLFMHCALIGLLLFFVLLSCWIYRYILNFKLLSYIWLSSMFSHYADCLFKLLTVSYTMQKLFSLRQSHLFILVFVVLAFGALAKKSLPKPISLSFPYVFFQEFYNLRSYT